MDKVDFHVIEKNGKRIGLIKKTIIIPRKNFIA